MIKQCSVELFGDDRFITDYDKYIPNRLLKRNLLGETDQGYYIYNINQLPEIINNTDIIFLVNPSKMITKYETAFDRIISIKKNIEKVVCFNNNAAGIKISYDDYDIDFEQAESLGLVGKLFTIKQVPQLITELRWNSVFLYTLYILGLNKIDKDRKTVIISSMLSVHLEQLIKNLDKVEDVIDKYDVVTIMIKANNHIESMLKITSSLDHRIIPIKYKYRTYTTRFYEAKKYTFLIEKGLVVEPTVLQGIGHTIETEQLWK